jgi:hypothetical protein
MDVYYENLIINHYSLSLHHYYTINKLLQLRPSSDLPACSLIDWLLAACCLLLVGCWLLLLVVVAVLQRKSRA